MRVVQLGRPEALEAWEPLRECVIACEVFERFEMQEHPEGGRRPVRIWEQRTYRCFRHGGGWGIDFVEGGHEPNGGRAVHKEWRAVVDWFCVMQPRKIEVLIDLMLDNPPEGGAE